jgi:hypothetical protein
MFFSKQAAYVLCLVFLAATSLFAASPVLRLELNEATGATTFADSSGYGYDGSCSGGTCPAAGQAGASGTAVSFDGSDDFIQVPDHPAFDFGAAQDFTVMVWVKSGNPHSWGNLISNKSAWHWTTQGFIVALWQDGATWTANLGDGTHEVHVEGGQINDNNWHNLAATFDRDGYLTVYQDFVQINRALISSVGSVSSFQPVSIGRLWDGSTNCPYSGLMDNIRIFNSALSLAEIREAAFSPAVVTSTNESGPGTLREKLSESATSPITFSNDMTIYLTTPLWISRWVTVDGTGHSVAVSGSNTCQVFSIHGSTVSLSYLTVRDGYVNACNMDHRDMGAGIHIDSGADVTLTGCTITSNLNQSCYGGGIQNDYSTLHMANCTVSNNTASIFWGGGLYTLAGSNYITNSTFSGNIAGSSGAIMNDGSYVGLQHCTFRGNAETAAYGAGVAIDNRNETSQTIMQNCLLANSLNGPNCGGNTYASASSTGNLDDDGSCNSIIGNFTRSSNLNLGSLGYYGGPTATIPLLPGSSAIDAGTTSACTPADQRGVARVDQCDAGAFESKGFILAKTGGDNQSATVTTRYWAPLSVSVTANDTIEPVNGGTVTFTPPSSGAGAAIDTSPVTISTGNASVIATANSTAGAFEVTAGLGGATTVPVSFSLTNLPPGSPPPVGNGKGGTTASTFVRNGSNPDIIVVSYDASHCSDQKAVILYGNIGSFTAGYAGCASSDAGHLGSATIDTTGLSNVWFNIIWADATTGGHPGYAFSGSSDVARTWTSAGLGGITADDQSHATCP